MYDNELDLPANVCRVNKPFNVFGIVEALYYNGQSAKIKQESVKEQINESTASIQNSESEAMILVVDDSKMNLRVARMILKKFGYQIDTALSGPESIEMVRKKDYKLIFMDHMMPEMDGVEALKEIRKLDIPSSASVPIVALTANALGEAREMLLAAGFSDFISKPIERSQMERVLKKFMHYGEN